ncbi:predicted protein [Aspergillus terreus NIH2624]|uniref:Heterokaryon incompatibility domain-containing protein n=1 Tax=Aspergillus terreus (strain NIH 2624 / FGSC A1156) TaxID=341663 RepID=Q0CBP9_ASPTN|nr:uncharacterized protein ATEG_08885 [Aspergillus terreus NIH2624]EAU31017.1 predicted protein [Aspergillus terreus NIH2624]
MALEKPPPNALRFINNGMYEVIPDEALCDEHPIGASSDGLCLLCQHMVSPIFLAVLSGNLGPGRSHFNHHQWVQLKKCAARDCLFCRYLVAHFIDGEAELERYSTTVFWEDGNFARHLRIRAPKSSPYEQGPLGPWAIRYHTPLDQLDYYAKWAATMYIHLQPSDGRDISEYLDGKSEASARRIKAALRSCCDSHQSCGTRDPPLLPRRVLDVQEMRLHISQPNQRAHYTALSYCWGGQQSFTTTTKTYSSFQDRILPQDVPQTLQDAAIVTRQLDLRYLWIDALCIIQDDPLDVAIEINSMTDIYKNATVVISAEAASSAGEGFLSQRLPSSAIAFPISYFSLSTEDLTVSITGPRPEGKRYAYLVPTDPRTPSALSTRAWIFQEFLLARRLLIFTPHGPLWICQQNPDSSSDFSVTDHEQNWLWRKYRDARQALCELSQPPPPPPERHPTAFYPQRLIWSKLVSTYAPLLLTYARDKLSAIAGIAREFHSCTGETYVAGLWATDLLLQLGWWRDELHHKQHRVLDAEMQIVPLQADVDGHVPSWSWASLPGNVAGLNVPHAYRYEEETALRVLEWQVELLHAENPFGAVKGGFLRVEGFVFDLTYLHINWNETSGTFAFLDCDGSRYFPRGRADFKGLFLGETPLGAGWGGGADALIIDKVEGKGNEDGDEVYRRVGHTSLSFCAGGRLQTMLEGLQMRRLVLI